MPRLFTGLEVPREVADALATQRGGLPGARWIDPENYHLTLRFIGDIDDAMAREIAFMLGQVKRRGFELRFDGLSSFGGRRLRDSSSRQVADYLAARGPLNFLSFRVSRFVLFSSRASVGGGPYVVEAAYPLAANDPVRAQPFGAAP